jgi:hypothetical protein
VPLAHAADYVIFAPVLLVILVIVVKSAIEQRRDRLDAARGDDLRAVDAPAPPSPATGH